MQALAARRYSTAPAGEESVLVNVPRVSLRFTRGYTPLPHSGQMNYQGKPGTDLFGEDSGAKPTPPEMQPQKGQKHNSLPGRNESTPAGMNEKNARSLRS
jgi:hypothetical protein